MHPHDAIARERFESAPEIEDQDPDQLAAAVLHFDGQDNPGPFAVAIVDREQVRATLPQLPARLRELAEIIEDPARLAELFHVRGLNLADFDAKIDDEDRGTDFAKDARRELARLLAT
jgi:hypothetical protein